jgi:hypothetical protein
VQHVLPSGGDWALQRHGALYIEGTEGLVIDSCVFDRMDSIPVSLNGM